MYLTALTLCLLLLPLGAPQLTGTTDITENLSKSSHGCINESMLENLQMELDQLKQAQLQHSHLQEIHFQQILDLFTQNPINPKGTFSTNPAPSCKAISSSSSGWYWIQSTTTPSINQEYCDMSNTRCGTRGWMRVANLDMTNTTVTQNCPAGFRYVSGSGYRGCGTHGSSCVSTIFPVHGVQYSKVCGRVNAYQHGSPDAFRSNRDFTIDSQYVDGVSLTHGQYPRKHIWTFAAAHAK